MDRTEYPTLNGPDPNAGGAALTWEVMERGIKRLTDPALRERRAKQQAEEMAALNLRAKTLWANSLGKTVDELTPEDMADLNDALFRAWLTHQGVTEAQFNEFFGI